MVWDADAGLRGDDLVDVMEVHTACEQQDKQEDTGDFLVVLVERIGNGLDLIFRDGLFQAGRDCHDEKGQPADPNDGREKMKPMVDDRNQLVEIDDNALQSVHCV